MEFSVSKSNGTMVPPSGTTPSCTLDLSRIDRLPVLRCNARTLHVFGAYGPPGTAQSLIRNALSKALVPYYPLAGRLKESPSHLDQQLQVQIECSGEGVWFVEASANCSLTSVSYFDDVSSIPFHMLLPHHPHESQGLDPLVLMQVTEFEGDGFVMGLTFCHTICDGLGAAQFLNAIAEFAKGVEHLTIKPVWQRNFLPQPIINHPSSPLSSTSLTPADFILPNYQLEQANIDIPLAQINQLKQKVLEAATGSHAAGCSSFEVIAAMLWKHRTQAINSVCSSNTTMKLVFFANCRQLVEPPLPKGFYGNCFFPVTITASSERLAQASIGDVVKLVQEAKARLPYEFANWVSNQHSDSSDDSKKEDPFAPPLGYATLFVSEWGRLGFNEVDYGKGPPIHVVPMQGSSIIPVAIVGWLPRPKKGIRLMTWCVEKAHMEPFLHGMHEQNPI